MQALAKLYDTRVKDKDESTAEHVKKLVSRALFPTILLLACVLTAVDGGHKRALSTSDALKPWELEQQLKEKAHVRAEVAFEKARSASGTTPPRREARC